MTTANRIDTANAIAQDAGTKFVQSAQDASWATKRALPLWQAQDIERRLAGAGIEASIAPDGDDRSVAWVYATLDELTAETITDKQIRALRNEARQAGDHVQLILCGIALDEYADDPADRRRELEGHAYSKLLSATKIRGLSVMTTDVARTACAYAINASAQDDSAVRS